MLIDPLVQSGSLYRSVGPKAVLFIDQLLLRGFCLYIS